MKIRYFPDTDTLYIVLTDEEVVETLELNENAIVDLDGDSNPVAITLEHARKLVNLRELSFEQVVDIEQIEPVRS
jgi:uncharacterized protein YuzE